MSRRVWLGWACASALAFVVLTIPVWLGYDWPGEWAVVEWALAARSTFWTRVMQIVTFFGSSAVGLGICLGCSAALLVYYRRQARRSWRSAALLAALPTVALLSSAPVNFGLRYLIGRFRPGVTYIPHRLPELSHPFQRWSYPAGHTMTAIIVYGLLVFYLLRARPALRPWALPLFALWLAAMSVSRVYLGVHWPTDVLGGLLAGGAWLSLWLAIRAGNSDRTTDRGLVENEQ